MQKQCFCNQKSNPYSQIIIPKSQRKNHPIFQTPDYQPVTKFARFPNLKPTSHLPANSSLSGFKKNTLCQEKSLFADKVKETTLLPYEALICFFSLINLENRKIFLTFASEEKVYRIWQEPRLYRQATC